MASFSFLEISGPPRERGRRYGESLRRRIVDRDRRWRQEIESAAKRPADDFIAEFLEQTRFMPAIETWTPDLLEEVRGIADGSGLPYPAVLAAQFMDEEWWFQHSRNHHCSSFGARREQGTIIGQTMDLPSWMDGFQTLLLVRGEAPGTDAFVVTVAGMIALMGINSRGLGVSVNTLLQLRHNSEGLPVAFVSRGLMSRPDFGAAVEFLRTVPHASGQNYVIGDPRNVASFECSAAGAVRYLAEPSGRRVWHTNHPLASTDLKADTSGPSWLQFRRNSEARHDALDRRLAAANDVTTALARETLSSRDDDESPVSRTLSESDDGTKEPFFTFAAQIAELTDDPVLWAAPGAPSKHAFERYDFGTAAARAYGT